MSTIYNQVAQFVDSGSVTTDEINTLIKHCLNDKDNNDLLIALEKAQEQNNVLVWNTIQNLVVEQVNFFQYQKNENDYKSYLLVLPFMTYTVNETINMPSIKTIESWWKESLVNQGLLSPTGSELHMAPVILSNNNVYTMTMKDWYQIHKTSCLTLSRRESRNMFSSPFTIKANAHKANLSFFVATLNFPSEQNEFLALFFEDIGDCLDDINQKFNHYIKDTKWLNLPFGRVNHVLSHSFETLQETLYTNMIDQYADNYDNAYIIVPNLDYKYVTCLVWNKKTNTVLDAVILNHYLKNFDLTIADISNLLGSYGITEVYMGKTTINVEAFNNLANINFAQYINTYGIVNIGNK